ncbi:hypothetical protein MPER_07216, partial [Moniliophthora perniciosa FA553]
MRDIAYAEENEETMLVPDLTRIAAIDVEDPIRDDEDIEPVKAMFSRRGKRKGATSQLEARDRRYLSYFIATKKCRRIPWDEFFANHEKTPPLFDTLPRSRCCDNCQPESFPVEAIKVLYPFPTRASRAHKVSDELRDAVVAALLKWRSFAHKRDYTGQGIIIEDYLLDNDIIQKIASRPRAVTDSNIFRRVIPWALGVARYGGEVVDVVSEQVRLHPDPQQQAREEAAKERHLSQFLAMVEKDQRQILLKVFDECYEAVYDVKTGHQVYRTRGGQKYLDDE